MCVCGGVVGMRVDMWHVEIRNICGTDSLLPLLCDPREQTLVTRLVQKLPLPAQSPSYMLFYEWKMQEQMYNCNHSIIYKKLQP